MNKKAFVFLYITSLAFIIAIASFYGSVDKQTPGWDTEYFGQTQIELFTTFQEAEQDMYYIELAAKLAAKEASPSNFEVEFLPVFNNYLNHFSLSSDHYDIDYQIEDSTMTIIGITSKNLVYQEDFYNYSISPNFKVTIPFETAKEDSGFIE